MSDNPFKLPMQGKDIKFRRYRFPDRTVIQFRIYEWCGGVTWKTPWRNCTEEDAQKFGWDTHGEDIQSYPMDKKEPQQKHLPFERKHDNKAGMTVPA